MFLFLFWGNKHRHIFIHLTQQFGIQRFTTICSHFGNNGNKCGKDFNIISRTHFLSVKLPHQYKGESIDDRLTNYRHVFIVIIIDYRRLYAIITSRLTLCLHCTIPNQKSNHFLLYSLGLFINFTGLQAVGITQGEDKYTYWS